MEKIKYGDEYIIFDNEFIDEELKEYEKVDLEKTLEFNINDKNNNDLENTFIGELDIYDL